MVTRILSTFHQWKAMAGPLPCPASQATTKWAAFSPFPLSFYFPHFLCSSSPFVRKDHILRGLTCCSKMYCCGYSNPRWRWTFMKATFTKAYCHSYGAQVEISRGWAKNHQQTSHPIMKIFLAKTLKCFAEMWTLQSWIQEDHSKATSDLLLLLSSSTVVFCSSSHPSTCMQVFNRVGPPFPSKTHSSIFYCFISRWVLWLSYAHNIFIKYKCAHIHTVYTLLCPPLFPLLLSRFIYLSLLFFLLNCVFLPIRGFDCAEFFLNFFVGVYVFFNQDWDLHKIVYYRCVCVCAWVCVSVCVYMCD